MCAAYSPIQSTQTRRHYSTGKHGAQTRGTRHIFPSIPTSVVALAYLTTKKINFVVTLNWLAYPTIEEDENGISRTASRFITLVTFLNTLIMLWRVGATSDSRSKCLQTCRINHQVKYWCLNANTSTPFSRHFARVVQVLNSVSLQLNCILYFRHSFVRALTNIFVHQYMYEMSSLKLYARVCNFFGYQ